MIDAVDDQLGAAPVIALGGRRDGERVRDEALHQAIGCEAVELA